MDPSKRNGPHHLDTTSTAPPAKELSESGEMMERLKDFADQEGEAKQQDIVTKGEVRYVLSGQPTGWAAMAETVRAYDQDKVQDCKEDMDTLLVFAGLFSAVLTAFLIESYQKLQPDTSGQMLEVLQQIALQTASYNMVNGVLNTTSSPPTSITSASSQPFTPSDNDIRVNVLWFASLIFSLITASFGILVKQWLREYLAVENPSPQARLRIRRFRYPELVKWNVFEIAAILPLLQQVALALFFLGLCYFTASVHQSVGHTSLPLVIGWAFCFLTATVLPAFFPRCPYKTTLLKHLFMSLHVQSVSALRFVTGHLSTIHFQQMYGTWKDYTLRWTTPLAILLEKHTTRSDERIAVTSERVDMDILVDVDALQSNDELLGSTITEALYQVRPEWTEVVQFVNHVIEHRLQRTDLAGGTPTPLNLQNMSRQGRTAITDILAQYAETEILQHIQSDQAVARWQKSSSAMTTFYIFLSPARYPLPESGLRIVRQCFALRGPGLVRLLADRCPRNADLQEDKFYLLVQGLSNALNDLDCGLSASLTLFEQLMAGRFQVQAPQQWSLAEDCHAWPWRETMSSEAMTYAANYLIETVRRGFRRYIASTNADKVAKDSPTTEVVLPYRSLDALIGMWQMSYIGKIEVFSHATELRFRSAMDECLMSIETTGCLLRSLLHVHPHIIIHAHTKWVEHPCGPWLVIEQTLDKLRNVSCALEQLIFGYALHAHNELTETGVLLICYVLFRVADSPEVNNYYAEWEHLFSVLTRLLVERFSHADILPAPLNARASTVRPSLSAPVGTKELYKYDEELARVCLDIVQRHDTDYYHEYQHSGYVADPTMRVPPTYGQWRETWNGKPSIFNDDLVGWLSFFVPFCLEEAPWNYRVRMLLSRRL